MKKRYSVIILALLVLSGSAAFAGDDVTVLVNGKKVVSDVPAAIVSDRTMLPFRAVFNALGVKDDSIKWDQNSRSIEVNSGGKYIFLAVGSPGALIGDTLITLDAVPYIENSRTFVPVRFVSEALGANVKWDENTRTVTITKKKIIGK